MRERARDKGRLEDIIEYSNRVTQFLQGVSLEKFTSNSLVYYAVMKNVEVVGEAAFMLTKAFKVAHPETPWKMIESMRHILVHDYAHVISETLYDTAVNSIPEFENKLRFISPKPIGTSGKKEKTCSTMPKMLCIKALWAWQRI